MGDFDKGKGKGGGKRGKEKGREKQREGISDIMIMICYVMLCCYGKEGRYFMDI